MAYKTLSVDSKLVEVINALKAIGNYETTQGVLDSALGLLMLAENSKKVSDKLILQTPEGKEFLLPKDMEAALHQLNHKLYDKFGGKMPEHKCDQC